MKVLAVLGSRNPKGRTAELTQALLDGLIEKDGAVETTFLPAIHLEACRQCEAEEKACHCCTVISTVFDSGAPAPETESVISHLPDMVNTQLVAS